MDHDRELNHIVLDVSIPYNSGGYYDYWSIENDAIHLSKKMKMKVKLHVTPEYSIVFDNYSYPGQEVGNMQAAATNWRQREQERIACLRRTHERLENGN